MGEIVALDEFHHERRSLVFFEPVDPRDVRMIERREHFCRAESEHGDPHCRPLRRAAPIATARFQVAVGRAVVFAHATGADGGNDFVRAETDPGESAKLLIIRAARGIRRRLPRVTRQCLLKGVDESRRLSTRGTRDVRGERPCECHCASTGRK